MAVVPADPELFFTEFFPAQYEAYAGFPRGTTPASASFEVSGVGTWSLRVEKGRLVIERGVTAESVLLLTMSKEDFTGLFVRRAEDALREDGELSDELRHAFFPLFISEQKRAIATSATGVLVLLLKDGNKDYRLSITPGAAPGATEKASVRLALSDFLGLTSGKKKVPLLLAMGRISVRGDVAHALKLSGLLS